MAQDRKPACPLEDDDYDWIREKREREALCKQRRSKVFEALLIWAAIGLATATVAGATGVARILWDVAIRVARP